MTTALNLCFHGIGTPTRELEPGEEKYWISADRYHRILDEVRGWSGVALSFDDGNASDVEIGLPGLLERGLTATFFLIAGRIGASGSVGPADVRALAAHGMPIGSHGMSHRPWRGLPEPERTAEFVAARRELARITGRPVDEAALPLGRYDRRVLSDLRRLGYHRVYSSDRRRARTEAWLQPRFSVTAADSPESLRRHVLQGPSPVAEARLRAKGWVKQFR
jgi:peptidoglycan/xylan/chitin deacetylase (PgdA/CDA1 family)